MTSVHCFHCGSEQDFEDTVGYCEQCGHKLPIPHTRGKTSARQKFHAEQRGTGLSARNGVITLAILGAVVLGFVSLLVF